MPLEATIRARYRYTGHNQDFYKHGSTYYITVRHKRFLWRRYTEVICERGYDDERYAYSPVFRYSDNAAFREDWKPA